MRCSCSCRCTHTKVPCVAQAMAGEARAAMCMRGQGRGPGLEPQGLGPTGIPWGSTGILGMLVLVLGDTCIGPWNPLLLGLGYSASRSTRLSRIFRRQGARWRRRPGQPGTPKSPARPAWRGRRRARRCAEGAEVLARRVSGDDLGGPGRLAISGKFFEKWTALEFLHSTNEFYLGFFGTFTIKEKDLRARSARRKISANSSPEQHQLSWELLVLSGHCLGKLCSVWIFTTSRCGDRACSHTNHPSASCVT